MKKTLLLVVIGVTVIFHSCSPKIEHSESLAAALELYDEIYNSKAQYLQGVSVDKDKIDALEECAEYLRYILNLYELDSVKRYADGLSKQIDAKKEEYAKIKFQNDSIRQIKHIDSVKNTIKIINYHCSSPDLAGGVDAYFSYKNLNDKTIKYLIWEAYPINAVGDREFCSIRKRAAVRFRDTGPIKKGKLGGSANGGCWECSWYNWQIKKLVLTEIEIQYMDGTKFIITGDDLFLIGKNH